MAGDHPGSPEGAPGYGTGGAGGLHQPGGAAFLAWCLRDLRGAPDIIPVWPLSGVVGCVIATFILRLQAFNTSHYAAFHLENILRSRLARKALQLAPGALQQMGSGSVAKVMLDDVKSLHIFVADSTPLYARAIIMPLATVVLVFWLDWRLAIATLGYWRLVRWCCYSPVSARKTWLSVIIRRVNGSAPR